MLALLGAMREEISEIRSRISVEESLTESDCRIYRGEYGKRDVLLVQTGMGREMAERATSFVLERFPVSAVVSFGLCGGLTEGLKAGDVVLCSPLHHGDGPVPADSGSASICHSDAGLLSLAGKGFESRHIRWVQGACVTVPKVVSKPKSKQDLGKTFSAAAVDMESYWIARIASERRIPFLAVRAVSDAMGDALPPFNKFVNPDGSLQRKKAALFFLSHPQDLIRLFRLYRNAPIATRNLATAIDCLVVGL